MPNPNGYIIFVDDDSDDRDFILESCTRLHFESPIRLANSGADLFNYLNTLTSPDQYPSLIVLDYNMPFPNGAEILLMLKRDSRYSHIPVVIFTTGSRFPERFLDNGAAGIFKKPYTYKEYWSVIEGFIQSVQNQQA